MLLLIGSAHSNFNNPHLKKAKLSRADYELKYSNYFSLPAAQKIMLWKTRIFSIDPAIITTPEQKRFLDELLIKIDTNLFNGHSPEKLDSLNKKAQHLFNKELFAFMFSSFAVSIEEFNSTYNTHLVLSREIDTSKPKNSKPKKENESSEEKKGGTSTGGKTNCTCSTSSDACLGLKICSTSATCSSSSMGCGFLWLYGCNGMCNL